MFVALYQPIYIISKAKMDKKSAKNGPVKTSNLKKSANFNVFDKKYE